MTTVRPGKQTRESRPGAEDDTAAFSRLVAARATESLYTISAARRSAVLCRAPDRRLTSLARSPATRPVAAAAAAGIYAERTRASVDLARPNSAPFEPSCSVLVAPSPPPPFDRLCPPRLPSFASRARYLRRITLRPRARARIGTASVTSPREMPL